MWQASDMMGSEQLCLAFQTPALQRSEWVALGAFVLVLVALGIIVNRLDARHRRQMQRLQEAQQRSNAFSDQQSERDQKAYAQHVALNDLTAEKIGLENQYLQLQLKIGQLEIEARSHNEEYHRLMSQKTQIEIQSLKLHIREQTKRLDDYTSYDDE